MTVSNTPPGDLSERGRSLWTDVLDAYELSPAELQVLDEAARTLDELERLRAALAAEDTITVGSTGQPVVNALFDALRRHRDLLARLLAALKVTSDAAA